MSGRLAGKRIFALSRVSGDKQVGNYSEQEQAAALERFITDEGGRPIPLPENRHGRGVSGRDLWHREVARHALDRIEAGEAEGIAWYDYKRLSRNPYQEDQGTILRRMAGARAVIVLVGDIVRPWVDTDRKRFQLLSAATEDGTGLRDTLYRGYFGRWSVEPVIRGAAPLGFIGRLVEYEVNGLKKTKRVAAKDPACAELFALLPEWFERGTTYGEVAGRINAGYGHLLGQPGNKGHVLGPDGKRRRRYLSPQGHPIWSNKDVRNMLTNAKYAGVWRLGDRGQHSDLWEIDKRRERIATDYTHYLPQLAYWTVEQAAGWTARLSATATGGRQRRARGAGPDGVKRARGLLGVLACPTCHQPMTARSEGRYGCPLRDDRVCARPVSITEAAALTALDAIVEDVLSGTRDLAAGIRREAAQTRASRRDPEALLALRREGLRSLVEQWYRDGTPVRRIPEDVLELMSRRQEEIDALELEVRRGAQAEREAEAAAAKWAGMLAEDFAVQVRTFRHSPPEARVRLWASLVAGVEIEGAGNGGAREYRVRPGWRLVAGGAGDGVSESASASAPTITAFPESLLLLTAAAA